MRKMYIYLFDIVAIVTNGKPLLKQSSSFSVLQQFCLLSGLPTPTVVRSPGPCSNVNLLNEDTYQCNSATIIMSSFGQIVQVAHKINKEILDLLIGESISGVCSGIASL